MPHHKSASKRLLTAEKSRQRNMAVKSELRKQLKQQATLAGDDAEKALVSTYALLDRAARKRVIPKRRADRLKSRFARNAAKAETS